MIFGWLLINEDNGCRTVAASIAGLLHVEVNHAKIKWICSKCIMSRIWNLREVKVFIFYESRMIIKLFILTLWINTIIFQNIHADDNTSVAKVILRLAQISLQGKSMCLYFLGARICQKYVLKCFVIKGHINYIDKTYLMNDQILFTKIWS